MTCAPYISLFSRPSSISLPSFFNLQIQKPSHHTREKHKRLLFTQYNPECLYRKTFHQVNIG
jgi:hypothetical protein